MTSKASIDSALGRPSGSAAWSNSCMGVFIVDHASPNMISLDSVVLRDAVACGLQLNDEATNMAVGSRTFGGSGSRISMIYLPRGERFRFSTQAAQGLRSVTIVLDIVAMLGMHRASRSDLPKTLQRALCGATPMMESLAPGLFRRIAQEVMAGHGMFAAMPSLYYEGKTCELISALLSQLARRDRCLDRGAIIDHRTVAGAERAKMLIEERPAQPIDIDWLAGEAAMNWTELRYAFKALYGVTPTEHRIAILMRMADDQLSEGRLTVQQGADRAGYSNPSSFIVAYNARPRVTLCSQGGHRRGASTLRPAS